jgi:hypothetical protein
MATFGGLQTLNCRESGDSTAHNRFLTMKFEPFLVRVRMAQRAIKRFRIVTWHREWLRHRELSIST